jgi:hypothetical protein
MVKVISRGTEPTTGVRTEVVVVDGEPGRRSGCYAEETRDVFGGAKSRRTVLYADDQAYAAALAAGKLRWGRWE